MVDYVDRSKIDIAVRIKFKKTHPDAQLPKANNTDAGLGDSGYDLHNIQPHLGVIDNGYRGDLGVKLYNFGDKDYEVLIGDRVAQFVVYPLIQPVCEWADEVEESDRGSSGFGSSGK